jgi:hypothetical protein
MVKCGSRILLACFCFLGAAVSLFGQAGSGELTGRVLDPSGNSISGVQVTAENESTRIAQQTVTTSSGDFLFVQLQSGIYRITVSANGFKRTEREGIRVEVGQRITADMTLQVGAVADTVIVKADAALLQTGGSSIQTVIHGTVIPAMPLNPRNFVTLAAQAPGVALPQGTVLPRINGGRPRTNEYLFDGISALQPEPGQVVFFPIVDDIQEFNIQSNNVPAEFGRFNGGVINLSTRGGTNRWHGSLYDFFRNEALNARNYFTPTTSSKPLFRRDQYGATAGGPILQNHLFFFVDYQGWRSNVGVVRTSTIPTANERLGIFSGVAKIYDPASSTSASKRTEFANDYINPKRFDSAANNLINLFPTPSNANAANNYTRVGQDQDHQNQFDTRVDMSQGHKDTAFGRYSYFHEVENPAAPFANGSGAISGTILGTNNVTGLSHITGQQLVLNEIHTFTPLLLNDLRLGYTRRSNVSSGTTVSGSPSTVLGIPGIPTNGAFNNALPLFTLTGMQQLGSTSGAFSNYETSVTQLLDTFSIARGAHFIKAGADVRWYQLNAIAPGSPTGTFAFTTTGTNLQGTSSNTGGNAIASFLLGQVDNFAIDLQETKMRPRDHIAEFFLQDDWKLSNKLTINAGVRWTLDFPSTEKDNQGAIFNLQTQQLQYLGQNGFSTSARNLHFTNVAPRVGFTYLLTPKTVVRSGFGIVFFDQSGITTPFTTPQYPYIQNVAQKTQDSLTAAFALSGGPTVSPISKTADAGLGQSVYSANRKLGSGYVQQWNFAVQRELTRNLSFEVAYVGSHVVHVGIPDANLNQLTTTQLALGSKLQTKIANPYYGQIPSSSSIGGKTITYAQSIKPYARFLNVANYRNNSGETHYNAFEAKVEQRLTRDISFLASYTRSKLIDDASSVFSTTVLSSPNSSSLIAADTYNPRLERDLSSGDMPNVFSANGTWKLPAGRNHGFASKGLAERTLGGWELHGLLTVQSGMPVTVTQATNNNSFAGYVLQRPNVTGTTSLPASQRSPTKYFNTSAFSAAGTYTLGNASRNPVRGPAYRDGDIALLKHTAIGDRMDAEFRAEIFNLTNTPAFAQPNGSYGSTAFGSITSTATDPRVVQFAIRLSY